jgi:hypothetical protein
MGVCAKRVGNGTKLVLRLSHVAIDHCVLVYTAPRYNLGLPGCNHDGVWWVEAFLQQPIAAEKSGSVAWVSYHCRVGKYRCRLCAPTRHVGGIVLRCVQPFFRGCFHPPPLSFYGPRPLFGSSAPEKWHRFSDRVWGQNDTPQNCRVRRKMIPPDVAHGCP